MPKNTCEKQTIIRGHYLLNTGLILVPSYVILVHRAYPAFYGSYIVFRFFYTQQDLKIGMLNNHGNIRSILNLQRSI